MKFEALSDELQFDSSDLEAAVLLRMGRLKAA